MPQVEDPDDPTFFVLVALVEVEEGGLDIPGEPRREHVLVRSELVSALPDDAVDHV